MPFFAILRGAIPLYGVSVVQSIIDLEIIRERCLKMRNGKYGVFCQFRSLGESVYALTRVYTGIVSLNSYSSTAHEGRGVFEKKRPAYRLSLGFFAKKIHMI